MKNIIKYIIAIIFLSPFAIHAQTVVQIDPLFEYPMAPDDLETFTDRTNYLVTHFWEKLDTKNTQPVNQIALNDAFQTYLTYIRYAEEKATLQSLDKLISALNGNPTLLVQFIKAAEDNLYGPKAEIWSDEVYLKFLDAGIKNKKISKTRKERYTKRAELLRATGKGATAPSFAFENMEGNSENYFPMATPTLLIFGDPEDVDWRLMRLRMESNTDLNQVLDKGKLNIIFIDITQNPDWKNAMSNYSAKWKVGRAEEIKDIYDIRVVPSVYLINTEGKIELKNQPVDVAVLKALDLIGG